MITQPPEPQVAGAPASGAAESFRRLRAEELVCRGDFVGDARAGFEPWEGPTGFRADAYVKPIFRKYAHRPSGVRKSS